MAKLLKGLKITITPDGLKVNTAASLGAVTNAVLKGLLSLYFAMSTDEESKRNNYEMLSMAMANSLCFFAPEYYLATEEELIDDTEAMAKLAAEMPDNSEEIAKIKAEIATHIDTESRFQPGETVLFDENGKAHFTVDES